MKTNALRIGDVALPGVPLPVFSFPLTAGLEGLFLFTDGEGIGVRNWAPGKADGTFAASPVAHDGYMRMNGGAYFQTQIAESAQMTLVTVSRVPVAANCGVFGNYAGSPPGVAIYATAERVNATAGRETAASPTVFAAAPSGQFSFCAATIPSPGATQVRNMTTGVSASSANAAARVLSTNGPLRVGRFYEASFVADVDVVCVAAYSTILTSPQLAALYGWAKDLAVGRGIAI